LSQTPADFLHGCAYQKSYLHSWGLESIFVRPTVFAGASDKAEWFIVRTACFVMVVFKQGKQVKDFFT
jgi:hypothetical protein